MGAKIRERLAVNKQGSQKFHMERFNLRNLNKVEIKEKVWNTLTLRWKFIALVKRLERVSKFQSVTV
jgi:hypothetical protein